MPEIDLSALSNAQLLYLLDRNANYERWASHPLAFAKDVFPHHFSRTQADFHSGLVEAAFPKADYLEGGKVAIAAPRGFAKSTIVSLLLPIWAVAQKNRHFIIICSNTHDQAVKFVQAIKSEFETNQLLKHWYPSLKPNKEKWSESEIELWYGFDRYKIIAKGAEAQLRGLKFLQHRPDLIIIDDGENDEMVQSESRLQDYEAWLNRVVLPTNPRAWILHIGTILAQYSMLNRIIRQDEVSDRKMYADWKTVLYQALANEGLPNEASTWEAHQPTEQLRLERERDPYGFAQEKQNNPLPISFCPFRPEYFRDELYYSDHELPGQLTVSITVDPACTDNENSDETVVTTAGWDANGWLWVLNEEARKLSMPSDIVELIFQEYVKWADVCKNRKGWDFYAVGIEGVSFQKFLKPLVEQRAMASKRRPYVYEIKADSSKRSRIWKLEPLFRERRIRLPHNLFTLENQLKTFGTKQKHDDRADCLSMHMEFVTKQPTAMGQAEPGSRMTYGEYNRLSDRKKKNMAANRFAGASPFINVL